MSRVVLIVDDSASLRTVVGMALRNAGYDVLEGCDGKDAMAKLRERLEELVGGFGEGEAHVVDAAIELRCELAGVEEEPPPPPAVSSKVGRNDPCPCGSGKKYKKCCGAAA